ncbi:MAG TPA: hypothetical protein VM689_17020 [Aliidongia sp.]|nr:hypothetical protein [Aliidongia sp.]
MKTALIGTAMLLMAAGPTFAQSQTATPPQGSPGTMSQQNAPGAGGTSKPGTAGLPGSKSGPTAKPSSTGAPANSTTPQQDQSKVPGKSGAESGKPDQKAPPRQ